MLLPFIISSLSASDKIPRTSFTPVVTAFTLRKLDLVVFAMISASVDFPQPGGPKKMQEVSLSASMAPAKALSDGQQSLTPDQFDSVMEKVKKVSELMGKTL